MRTAPWLTLLPLLLLAGACPQRYSEAGGGCVDTPTDLAIDEVSPLGFAADEVLAAAEGPRLETLAWSDGAETGIAIEIVQVTAAIRFVDSEPAPSDGGMELAAAALCEDRVEIGAQVTVVTDDGALNETLDVTLQADEPTSVDFTVADLAPGDLAGAYTLRELDPAEWDTVSVSVHAGIGMDGSWGSISEFGEWSDPNGGDEGVAMAEIHQTGIWPPQDDEEF